LGTPVINVRFRYTGPISEISSVSVESEFSEISKVSMCQVTHTQTRNSIFSEYKLLRNVLKGTQMRFEDFFSEYGLKQLEESLIAFKVKNICAICSNFFNLNFNRICYT
jgi:hypothetical protein